jgi:hypothetical protein
MPRLDWTRRAVPCLPSRAPTRLASTGPDTPYRDAPRLPRHAWTRHAEPGHTASCHAMPA